MFIQYFVNDDDLKTKYSFIITYINCDKQYKFTNETNEWNGQAVLSIAAYKNNVVLGHTLWCKYDDSCEF